VPPYNWSVSSGSLPAGLSLDPATGVVSGMPLLPGTASFTVSVADSESPPMTATAQLSLTVVGCTTTISGTHHGPLVIGPGVTCLASATVTGPVSIGHGAVVSVADSHLSGPLHAAGTASLAVCGSQIGGPVAVTGSSGFVLVGGAGDDGSPGCAADTIGGPAVLTGNTGGAELGGNTIDGPAVVTGNSGPGPDQENAAPEVEANHITGPLSGTDNSPAPGDDGQPNTTGGPATGQCAGLT
jgi:hexosaminidase